MIQYLSKHLIAFSKHVLFSREKRKRMVVRRGGWGEEVGAGPKHTSKLKIWFQNALLILY